MEYVAITILTLTCVTLFIWSLMTTRDYNEAAKKLSKYQFTNPYARLLGRTVEAKVYEGSKWEPMVIVAVSWHGSVAVRPLSDLSAKARWIHKAKVPERVKAEL